MKPWLVLLILVAAAGCQSADTGNDPSRDIHAFFVAVRDGDTFAFEARIDRSAVLTAAAHRQSLAKMAYDGVAEIDYLPPRATLSGYRSTAASFGYREGERTPRPSALKSSLRYVEPTTVCIARPESEPEACTLKFSRVYGVWKLTA